MDEVELLLFESKSTQSLPEHEEIQALKQIKRDQKVGYNAHLPVDAPLAATNDRHRKEAVDRIRRVIALTRPLDPSSYTLHIPPPPATREPADFAAWQGAVRDSLEQIVQGWNSALTLAIENLNYPLEWLETIIFDLDLAVCMDVGHLIVHGCRLDAFCSRFGGRIALMHLHGVQGKKDHLALDRLQRRHQLQILSFLETFTGTVSLEVFDFQTLAASLDFFDRCWAKRV